MRRHSSLPLWLAIAVWDSEKDVRKIASSNVVLVIAVPEIAAGAGMAYRFPVRSLTHLSKHAS
jgi:ABC-type spermidine/putrescine transport system permease subunit II